MVTFRFKHRFFGKTILGACTPREACPDLAPSDGRSVIAAPKTGALCQGEKACSASASCSACSPACSSFQCSWLALEQETLLSRIRRKLGLKVYGRLQRLYPPSSPTENRLLQEFALISMTVIAARINPKFLSASESLFSRKKFRPLTSPGCANPNTPNPRASSAFLRVRGERRAAA